MAGPRGPDCDEPPSGGVPRGLEVLLKKASVDPRFRGLLLEEARREALLLAGDQPSYDRGFLFLSSRGRLRTNEDQIFARRPHPA